VSGVARRLRVTAVADLELQVRGKKNLVIERSLAGPIGLIVKVSTLQDYGVDKFFFLESKNAGTNQRNVVFIARGECARNAQEIAGRDTHFAPLSPMWLNVDTVEPYLRSSVVSQRAKYHALSVRRRVPMASRRSKDMPWYAIITC
jgi:hypothetical protein